MSNHLKPCPFCGGDASFNEHTDDCYFTVLGKLKSDPPADLSRVPDLIEAWNTRTAIQQSKSKHRHWSEALADDLAESDDIQTDTHPATHQAEAKTDEPVYWEWRHQGSHPDAVDFGQWSEWKRVEPRSALHTVEDALNEFRGYIARGHKYELRALYTHPAPGVPDGYVLVRELVEHIERNTCTHEETHRGGAIWEVCDSCGARWADDEGGKPTFKWPPIVEKARAELAAAQVQKGQP